VKWDRERTAWPGWPPRTVLGIMITAYSQPEVIHELPELLYPSERRIYHPELTACPQWGTSTHLLNYLAWVKTVQILPDTLSIAVRPSQCPDPACPGRPCACASSPLVIWPCPVPPMDVMSSPASTGCTSP
jgi:hypothetical protein